MTKLSILPAAIVIASGLTFATEAGAVDGVILITQAKALKGNVTPGDAAGFPVKLTLSGSYRLAGNLTPPSGKDGIVVAAPDITIDLNGFKMSGGPAGGTNNARDGIVDRGDRLTVKNGTIGAFKLAGINAESRLYLVVEDMRIINNGTGVFNKNGSFSRIINSTVSTNVGIGIHCGQSCHVEGNVVSGNGSHGIDIRSGTVLGNTITSNISYGIAWTGGSGEIVGFGNNTLDNNQSGGAQFFGAIKLFPNACSPVAC